MLKRFLSVVLFALAMGQIATAQVTTSSMGGVVKSASGEMLTGATITATHLPTGTVYRSISRSEGRYDIQNMNPGGPYTVTATYVGYTQSQQTDVTLALGEEYRLDFTLAAAGGELQEVVISANANRNLKSGASTNITNRQINTLPSISRSINDFTRLTPQAGNNGTFNGRDARFNNITIDGANFNNNFGLGSNNLPGGDAQPISLDAIDVITVSISPYDVKQGNFTGAGISAITRSGTNTFTGSAYTFYRNQNFNGKKVGDQILPELEESTNKLFGARIGGPIIKNKLFFFINGEQETRSYPGLNWKANSGSEEVKGNTTRVLASDLDKVSEYVRTKYGYETGPYQNLGNFASKNTKALGRIDWNINDNHRVALRYNYVKSTNDQSTNATSAPNPRASSARWSKDAMAYENANYGFEDLVSSWTLDLKSKISNKANNQLLATYTNIETNRTSGSTPFPFVDIQDGAGNQYISLGYELFSYRNSVKNKVITVADNFNYNVGKHNLTGGASFDHMYFGNSFLRYGTSYYRFASMDAFLNNDAPTAFALTYGYNGTEPIAELTFGQLALYAQDEVQLTPKFKLLAGVRVDKPIYLEQPANNPSISEKTFQDLGGNPYKFDVGSWPDSKWLWSPRLGFNYDVEGNRDLVIRGGTGIFTGRLPFVWYTNQPTNSYALQATVERVGADAAPFLFNPDGKAYADEFPQSPSELPSGASLAIVDKNFVFPQVWRSSLAFDKRLPWNLLLTMEAIYTKDVNALFYYNSNLAKPNSSFTSGPDQRPRYTNSAARSVDASVREAMVLTNTDKGNGFSYTVQLSRNFVKGFYGQIAYSYNNTMDLSSNPGDQAASAWSNLLSVRTNNDLDLSTSQYSIPHRVTAAFSYKFEYAKNFATTLSLLYAGSSQGRYSYRYSNDMNNDGVTNDLMYIPKDRTEAGLLIPNATEADAFWSFLQQDDYLKKHVGQYAEYNGALMPWVGRLDARLLQDFIVHAGGRKHTLQFSVDMLNFGNLLNKNWGNQNRLYVNNAALLKYASTTAAGVPQFTFNKVNSEFPTTTFEKSLTVSSTWGMQLGLRYIF
jgi:hypothetical protein